MKSSVFSGSTIQKAFCLCRPDWDAVSLNRPLHPNGSSPEFRENFLCRLIEGETDHRLTARRSTRLGQRPVMLISQNSKPANGFRHWVVHAKNDRADRRGGSEAEIFVCAMLGQALQGATGADTPSDLLSFVSVTLCPKWRYAMRLRESGSHLTH